jgi:Zn-dependent alcohol dehydrogenase
MAMSACLACSRPPGSGRSSVIALGRNPGRQKLARQFGATEIVEARGARSSTN